MMFCVVTLGRATSRRIMKEKRCFLKLAVLCLLITLVAFTVALLSPDWLNKNELRIGLWRKCKGECDFNIKKLREL